jgi:hypothetical protein
MIYILLSFFTYQSYLSNESAGEHKKIEKILILKLPNSIAPISAIDTEERFNNYFNEIDTTLLNINEFKINLGKQLKNYTYIDIRTKVLVHYIDGTQKKFFLDNVGHVLFNSKIYEGSYEQLMFLRGVISE